MTPFPDCDVEALMREAICEAEAAAAALRDSELDAGKLIKATLNAVGGRGGGTANLAQGSVPSGDALERALTALSASPPD